MCGIAGVLRRGNGARVEGAALASMARALAHRGPDDEGIYLAPSGACGLGARRLSIIDLVTGHQPLSSEDSGSTGSGNTTCWVVQNGEIYNYKALRHELEALGHRFRTQSDTEVIVHAYEEWGEGFVARLWGMFALAVWDERRQRLLLARDRFGIKPLYLAQPAGMLLFASEMKSLLRHPALAPTLDARSLEDMFTVGFVPGPATIWREVEKLPPAHALVATADGSPVRTWRYWEAPFPEAGDEEGIDPDEAAEVVRSMIEDAVRLRLQSDVPVGALLSGGLDSAGIVALMQAQSGGRAHTFSIGFQAASHDESRHALLVSRHLKTEHHVLRFDWDAFDLLPRVVAALDQPQCFATAVPIFLLYEACHQAGFKVILTGEGSDELFAGYHRFRGNRLADPLLRLPQMLRRTIFDPRLPWPMTDRARRVVRGNTRAPVARYLAWLQVAETGRRQALLSPALQAELASSARPPLAERWQQRYASQVASLAPLHRDQLLEQQLRLPDFINHEVDAMSMASSVEARVPYLDHRLWELVARWPSALKLQARRPEKWLLRQAYARDLPAAILARRKQGLATPHAGWWRRPTMPEWVHEALAPASLNKSGLFSAPTVSLLHAEHRSGQANHAPLLTGVLNVQLWLQVVGNEARGRG